MIIIIVFCNLPLYKVSVMYVKPSHSPYRNLPQNFQQSHFQKQHNPVRFQKPQNNQDYYEETEERNPSRLRDHPAFLPALIALSVGAGAGGHYMYNRYTAT